ncbi:MAG: hypothetical protein ACKVPY_03655 [Paracoccaceae bacterium]
MFNEVCGKTYPTFEGAEARARAIGFPMGAKNPSKLLSVYAFSNSRGRRGCSVQYSTVEAEHTLNKNIRLLDGFQVIDSDNGVARFRNTKHFIEVSIRPPKGGRTVVDIRLEFESQ